MASMTTLLSSKFPNCKQVIYHINSALNVGVWKPLQINYMTTFVITVSTRNVSISSFSLLCVCWVQTVQSVRRGSSVFRKQSVPLGYTMYCTSGITPVDKTLIVAALKLKHFKLEDFNIHI